MTAAPSSQSGTASGAPAGSPSVTGLSPNVSDVSESAEVAGRLDEDQAPRIAAVMGLLPAEYQAIRAALDRTPSHEELAVFAGMWSEHCSYKSTRHLLATLPKEGRGVLAGPGSHAGVVDVGEGWAVAFKIESHNHPSAVEPYQGAATGVGGILRDVIAQGARPCALLDFLCFGDLHSPQTARIKRGVVAGIAGYGNAIGVPNVGGRTQHHPGYEGNPLVNALAAGLIRPQEGRTACARGVGNVVLLVGASTGRDGILGAAFASEALGTQEQNRSRRSHIQVGDPFAGKLLMEAVLTFPTDLGPVAAQDLGACGIACATFEMAALGGVGMDVDLSQVPLREADMSPLEIFLSESQERFALVVRPEHVAGSIEHFQRFGLNAAAIGVLTERGRVRVRRGEGQSPCIDLPAGLVAGGAPPSQFPIAAALPPIADLPADCEQAHEPLLDTLRALLSQQPDTEPTYSQFDQTVGNRTIRGPAQAAAAVLRLPDSMRGFALTLTGRGDLCAADPYLGAQAALAEAVRRLACVGAEMLAITDGLNFASPRDPLEHRRIAQVIAGLGDGLRTLGVPVTGGNVSLYNESPRGPIPPTPMVGAIGIVPDVRKPPAATWHSGHVVVLLGALADEVGAGLYTRLRYGRDLGRPRCDLQAEQALARLLIALVEGGHVDGLATVSQGGLLTALGKTCLRSGVGIQLHLPPSPRPHWQLFGEHPAQVLAWLRPDRVGTLWALAAQHAIPITQVGEVGGASLVVPGHGSRSIAALAQAFRDPGKPSESQMAPGKGSSHVS